MNEKFFEKRSKNRHYLHFDDKHSAQFLFDYVCKPSNIHQHSFYPFIHYQIGERKYHKEYKLVKDYPGISSTLTPSSSFISFNQKGKKISNYKDKIRDINFPSHLDGHIYAYYSYLLTAPYEQFLQQHALQEQVLAFRKVYKTVEDIKISQCNIHFCVV